MKRFVSRALLLSGLLLTLLPASPKVALSAPPLQSRNCVLACHPIRRVCSLFDRARVPSGFVRVNRLLVGYKRVKSESPCENMVCISRSTVCSPWTMRP